MSGLPWAAEVAVSDATIYYDKLYTYAVPAPVQGRIFVGSMVLVPFGRGRARPRTGVVLALKEVGELSANVKPLYDAAPEDARLTDELLAIVKYLKNATFCTWFEAVRAVIPYGAQYRPVQQNGGWVLQKKLVRHTEATYLPAPLLPEGAEGAKTKKTTAKQQAVLEALADGTPQTGPELEKSAGASRAVLATMVKNGLLLRGERDRELFVSGGFEGREDGAPPQALSAAQQGVADTLLARMGEDKPKPALLYGVTGSGKTLVFLRLVRAALSAGKTALVLVPEIGLTPQMIYQLRAAFGKRVAVQHSGLSNTERLLQWRQIQRGQAQVVVGTRSAVFAPLSNIDVIIVDEEQEHTYQSESAPRYDALAVARRRAAYHGALLLLASATPAVADFYAANTGRFELLRLPERYGNLPLPAVEMVDMRAELQGGNAGVLSGRLADEIDRNLQNGEQTIILLNRRGYRTVGMCRACGQVLKCTECSVPMVYHKAGERLLCHYCGKTVHPVPQLCPECGGEMRYTGFGTQHLEEELEARFPTARVLRMDLDSTGRKGAHADMLTRFGSGAYDILLGTQMVAKGLDFERVSLVGVVGIDSLLFSQGYRAFENVFALVTQVVGRSGRAGAPGRALIQTVDPLNPVLALAARQDYDAFYKEEIGFRKLALYPPFCSICVVGFVAASEADALGASRRFSQLLAGFAAQHRDVPLRILGPAPMSVMQVAGSYRYRLTLKCRENEAFRALARQALDAYHKEGLPKKATVFLDFHSDAGT